jgi:hypothetical protein
MRSKLRPNELLIKAAGFLTPLGCHTSRPTGFTIYLENDGRLEHAQQMAGYESPPTTKLYDRTKEEITLTEVERIRSPKPSHSRFHTIVAEATKRFFEFFTVPIRNKQSQ